MKRTAIILTLVTILLNWATPVANAHCHGAYYHGDGPLADRSRWMAGLPDAWLLSRLSLPGTHNTMATGAWGDIYQCQSMSVKNQLQAGIRVLDIRFRHENNRFKMVHDIWDLGTYFEDVYQPCIYFLDANPDQFILMVMSQDDDPEGCTRTVEQTWNSYMALGTPYGGTVGDWFYKPPHHRVIPKVADMRGKILLIDDFPGPCSYQGLCYDSIIRESDYDFPNNWYLDDKIVHAWQHILKAAKNPDDNKYYETSLSGSGGSFPYFVASGHSNPATCAPRLATGMINTMCGFLYDCPWFYPHVACFLGTCTVAFEGTNVVIHDLMSMIPLRRVGIIFADFPGTALIDRIIATNFVDCLSDIFGCAIPPPIGPTWMIPF